MADDPYAKKLQSLQKHVPFVERMIASLKNSSKTNVKRDSQLDKMVALNNMITDTKKRYKLETLQKCEEVIMKLQTRTCPAISSPERTQEIPESDAPETSKSEEVIDVGQIMQVLQLHAARKRLQNVDSTPRSPSPEGNVLQLEPKLIPTEKLDDNDVIIVEDDKAPSIYASAAESLIKSPSFTLPVAVPDPDTTKPLLSAADLELLEKSDDIDVLYNTPSKTSVKNTKESEGKLHYSKPKPVPSSKPKTPKPTTDIKVDSKAQDKKGYDKNKNDNKSKSLSVSKPKDKKVVQVVGKRSSDIKNTSSSKSTLNKIEFPVKPTESKSKSILPIVNVFNKTETSKLNANQNSNNLITCKSQEGKVYERIADKYVKKKKAPVDDKIGHTPLLNTPQPVPHPNQTMYPQMPNGPHASNMLGMPIMQQKPNYQDYPHAGRNFQNNSSQNYRNPMHYNKYPNADHNMPYNNCQKPYNHMNMPYEQFEMGKNRPVDFYSPPHHPYVNDPSPNNHYANLKHNQWEENNRRNSIEGSYQNMDCRRDPRMRNKIEQPYNEAHASIYDREHNRFGNKHQFKDMGRPGFNKYNAYSKNNKSWDNTEKHGDNNVGVKESTSVNSRDPRQQKREQNFLNKDAEVSKLITANIEKPNKLDAAYSKFSEKGSNLYLDKNLNAQGIQNFKIPKKPKPVELEIKEVSEKEVEPQPESSKISDEKENKTEEKPEVKKIDVSNEGEASQVNAKKKSDDKKKVKKESSDEEIKPRKIKANDLNIENLISSDDSDNDVIIQLLKTVLNKKKLKKKRHKKVIKSSSSESEQEPEPEEKLKKKKKKYVPKPKSKQTPKNSDVSDNEEVKSAKEKRKLASVEKTVDEEVQLPKTKKRRSELDKLHEDIKEMLQGQDTFQANSKRLCTTSKEEKEKDNNTNCLDSPISKATSLRVVLEKLDLSKEQELVLENDEKPKSVRTLRSNKEKSNYTEVDSDGHQEKPEEDDVKTKGKPNRKRKPIETETSNKVKSKKVKLIEKKEEETVEDEVESDEEDKTELEILETEPKTVVPCKDYYIKTGVKRQCQLCSYSSLHLTNHYRNSHPNYEVFISRLSPEESKRAIKEGIQKKFDKITEVDMAEKRRLSKFNFQCRFCLKKFFSSIDSFYEHLTVHTGEYRYHCPNCTFKTPNKKTLRIHLESSHKLPHNIAQANTKPIRPLPPNFPLVFAYICSECNYLQLQKHLVLEHGKIYHSNRNLKVHKINVSLVDDLKLETNLETESTIAVAPTKDSDEVNMDSSTDIEPSSSVSSSQHSSKDTFEIVNEIVEEPKTTTKSRRAKTLALSAIHNNKITSDEEKTPPKIKEPVKTKEPALNVFLCDTDILEENQNINENRFKAMEKINEKIKLDRKTIADRLISRLETTTEKPFTVIDKTENKPIIDKSLFENQGITQIANLQTERVANEEDIENNENQSNIDNLILNTNISIKEEPKDIPSSQLIDKIKEERSKDNPSPPLIDKIKEEKLSPKTQDKPPEYAKLTVKSVEALNACKRFLFNVDDNKEKINIGTIISRLQGKLNPPNLASLKDIEIAKASSNTVTIGPIKIQYHNGKYVFCCFVPSCVYKTVEQTDFAQHCLTKHLNYPIPTPKCEVCNVKMEKLGIYLRLNDVYNHMLTHLDDMMQLLLGDKPENEENWVSDINEPVIKMSENSSIKITNVMERFESEPATQSNKLPFVISNVMSLASKPIEQTNKNNDDTPPMSSNNSENSSPNKQSSNEKVVLVEVPLKPEEIIAERMSQKCPDAIQRLLKVPGGPLYKCPEYKCFYGTNDRTLFELHLGVHFTLNRNVVCFYCNFKVPTQNLAEHITLRHALSKFTCGHCFYRAVSTDYLKVHYLHLHPKHPPKIIVSNFAKPVDSPNFQPSPPPISRVVLPYICGVQACKREFLSYEGFKEHLKEELGNGSTFQCDFCSYITKQADMFLTHQKVHERFMLQCRFCLNGSEHLNIILKHLALEHCHQAPQIIFRKFRNDYMGVDGPTNESYASLVKYPDNFKCNNVPLDFTSFAKFVANINKSLSANLTDLEKCGSEQKENAKDNTGKNLNNTVGEIGVNNTLKLLENDKAGENEEGECIFMDNTEVLQGDDLYKCPFCSEGSPYLKKFKIHLTQECQAEKPDPIIYKCTHCEFQGKNVSSFVNHTLLHGTKRYSCSMCSFKGVDPNMMKIHLKNTHRVTNSKIIPLDLTKSDKEKDKFVFVPVVKRPSVESPASTSKEGIETTATNKTIYNPSEINKLPVQSILAYEVYCALCEYKTKVKLNMAKHLQQHLDNKIVAVSAPVNPVPCLEKNEKMFDKMVNLAGSSHIGSLKIEKPSSSLQVPQFVPSNRRFACGSDDCSYLTLDEVMLGRHITTLHSEESEFLCKHCDFKMPKTLDSIIKHLRLHDSTLYKCGYCDFMHQYRNKIERHLNEKHTEKPLVKTLREMANGDETETVKQAKLWKCVMCKFKCNTHSEILTHMQAKHEVNVPFKCALCTFSREGREEFQKHFENEHPGHSVDILCLFYKENEANSKNEVDSVQADTTPLWTRSGNKVKHIRGILLEETRAPGKPKTPVKNTVPELPEMATPPIVRTKSTVDNLSLCIDNVATGLDSVSKDGERKEKADVYNINHIDEDFEEAEVTFKRRPSFLKHDSKQDDELIGLYGTFGDPKDGKFACPTCSLSFVETTPLKEHLCDHLKYYRFGCSECSEAFTSKSIAQIHILQHSTSSSILNLPSDPLKDQWIKRLIQIQTKLKQNPQEDSLCDITFEQPNDFSMHQKEAHEGKQSQNEEKKITPDKKRGPKRKVNNTQQYSPSDLKCHYCDMIASLTALRDHHKKQHKGFVFMPYRYICSECNERFRNKEEVEMHCKDDHGDKGKYSDVLIASGVYKCPVCSYSNNKQHPVREHVRIHAKYFKCSVCHIIQSHQYLSNHHMKIAHPNNTEAYTIKIPEKEALYHQLVTQIVVTGKANKEIEYAMEVDSQVSDELLQVQKVEMDKTFAKKTINKTARKSTSVPRFQEGFSYYGQRPENLDLQKVMTTVEVAGNNVNMSVEQFATFFPLFPIVSVMDCQKQNLT